MKSSTRRPGRKSLGSEGIRWKRRRQWHKNKIMAKLKLRGKDIRALGYPEGPVISIAMNIMEKEYKFEKEDVVMNLLHKILAAPVEYANDAVLGLIAQQLLPKQEPEGIEISLNKTGI